MAQAQPGFKREPGGAPPPLALGPPAADAPEAPADAVELRCFTPWLAGATPLPALAAAFARRLGRGGRPCAVAAVAPQGEPAPADGRPARRPLRLDRGPPRCHLQATGPGAALARLQRLAPWVANETGLLITVVVGIGAGLPLPREGALVLRVEPAPPPESPWWGT